MNFNQQFLGNSVADYACVIGIFIVIWLAKRILSKLIAAGIFRFTAQTIWKTHKTSFINLVLQPIEKFLVALITISAIDQLKLPEYLNVKIYHVSIKQCLNAGAAIILIVLGIRVFIRIITFAALLLEEKQGIQPNSQHQLILFFKDFFKVIFIIIGGILILHFAFGKDIGNLLTGLSIVGAAIALATKESLENLIASFIIFFDKPFQTGDLIKVQGITGVIEKIGLRSTRIRTEQKTYVTVPNKQMVDTITDNLSLRTFRKIDIKLELSNKNRATSIQQFQQSLQQYFQQLSPISSFQVHFFDIFKQSLVLHIELLVQVSLSQDEFNTLKNDVHFAVLQLIEAQQIKLAPEANNA